MKDDFGQRVVEVGELIPILAREMERGLMECIAQNGHRREPYWILYTGDWYLNGEEFRDTFTPFGIKPPKMLNTICWRVDNKSGRLDEIWVLPKDAPADIIDGNRICEEIAAESKGLPITY